MDLLELVKELHLHGIFCHVASPLTHATRRIVKFMHDMSEYAVVARVLPLRAFVIRMPHELKLLPSFPIVLVPIVYPSVRYRIETHSREQFWRRS